jgi:hypothetical protein
MMGLSLNNQGQAAFFAEPSAPSQNGIFSFLNGTLTPLALNGSAAPGGGTFYLPFWESSFGPVSNDNGSIAFATYITSYDESGIFLYANNTLSRIAGPGDAAPGGGSFESAYSPSINASGQIAFLGYTTTNAGLFVYSNGQITKVVENGEVIGGETLGNIVAPQLNDNGVVAFTSNLTNNTNGIFLATPKTVRARADARSGLLTGRTFATQ